MLCRCFVDNCIVVFALGIFANIYFEFAERAKVRCAARKQREKKAVGAWQICCVCDCCAVDALGCFSMFFNESIKVLIESSLSLPTP